MLLVLVKTTLSLGTFCSACSFAILFWKVEAAAGGGEAYLIKKSFETICFFEVILILFTIHGLKCKKHLKFITQTI